MRAAGSLFCLALLIFFSGCRPASSKNIGAQAPDFILSSLESSHKKVSLSQLYSKNPVMLIFWASWCPACVEEIPKVNELSKEHEKNGLKILGVNVQESREDLQSFITKQPIDYPVVLDEDGAVAERYGLVGLPACVLLARGGEILYYGFSLPQDVQELLEKRRVA